tara:strand:- start:16 stop:927 length:912 start_codon:yes stop_codon:yes gene_type:complete
MSKNMTGKAKLPNSASITIHGHPGQDLDVSVDIQGEINRNTDSKRVKKYLKDGWKWTLYSRIIVAKFPNKEMLLLDGDHRRHMYKLAFPEAETIPAYVIDVDSMEEYHKLFYEINWEKRKSATKEEVFVQQVKAKIAEAVSTNLKLISCGVSVCGSSDPGGTVGFTTGPNVTVGAFRRTLKRGEKEAKLAIDTVRSAWPTDTKLQGELMEAVAVLYKTFPVLSDGSVVDADFKNWFSKYLSMYNQHMVASDYKSRGGRVHHKHAESIARGLIMDFRRIQLVGGTSASYKQKKLPVAKCNGLIE